MDAVMTLQLDWASHQAAEHACKRWHYSQCMPAGKLVKIGVWEHGRFIGVVIFGRGANRKIGMPYKLDQTQCCELVRVALDQHDAPVSRVISIALRFLKRANPGLRLVVSYAASEHNHHGGIYQAGNWIYTGAMDTYVFWVKGRPVHARSLAAKYGRGSQKIEWLRANLDPHAYADRSMVRHKYLMPLDAEMRVQIEPMRLPYPKREKQAMAGDQPEQRRCDTDPHAPI